KTNSKFASGKPAFPYWRSSGRTSRPTHILTRPGRSYASNLKRRTTTWTPARLPTERSAIALATTAAPTTATRPVDALIAESPALLVDFHTQWCNPCQEMASVMDQLGEKHGDDTVARVDVDASEELAAREKIAGVPVLVLYESGKEIYRHADLISFA